MRYRHFTDDLRSVDKIVVDGDQCGAGLQLSHWPGNDTPAELKSDLSVESVLRLLVSPHREEYLAGRELVTNDHYDTDGLLAIWAMLNPSSAVRHGKALIDAAAAGDFYEFATPAAVQFDLTVRAFGEEPSSPLADRFHGRTESERAELATETLFLEMPDLLYDASSHRSLWEREYDQILSELAVFNAGRITVRERPEESLSVILTPAPLHRHVLNLITRGNRVLEAIPATQGTIYRLHYRECLWYDLVTRPTSPKHLLLGTAKTLNRLEPVASGGSWAVTKWTPALFFLADGPREARIGHHRAEVGHSRLDIETVEEALREDLLKLDRRVFSDAR